MQGLNLHLSKVTAVGFFFAQQLNHIECVFKTEVMQIVRGQLKASNFADALKFCFGLNKKLIASGFSRNCLFYDLPTTKRTRVCAF